MRCSLGCKGFMKLHQTKRRGWACTLGSRNSMLKIRSTETSRWAEREGACGAAAENKVTKGKVRPGSRQARSRGVWVRCDYAQLLQWTEPVALDALLTHSCWTQINLTDYLTNRRVKSGNSSRKRYCGVGSHFQGTKYYQPESEEQKELLMLNNGLNLNIDLFGCRKFFCLRRSISPQRELRGISGNEIFQPCPLRDRILFLHSLHLDWL